MEPITFILAVIITLVSGIVGGMVGGSYLILIPGLLFLGWDIHHVIGITKITTVALGLVFINYMKNGKVNLKFSWPYALLVFLGSIVGSFIVIELSGALLQTVIAIFMIIIALFMLFNKNFGVNPLKIKVKKIYVIIAMVSFLILGVYMGFYAAASSVFSIAIFSVLLKKDFVESIGSTRFNELVAGTGAALIFAFKGLIDYKMAIPIAVVYFVGAWLGSNITLKKGSAFIRYVIIFLSIAFAIKLLFFG